MKTFLRLLAYLKPYKWTFMGALCLVGFYSGLELLKPWPLKLAVDQIISQQPLTVFGVDLPWLTLEQSVQMGIVVGMMLGSHFLLGMVSLLSNYVTIKIGQNMVQDFRTDFFDHVQRQSLLFHQKRPTGDLIYRLTGDTYAVQSLLMNGVFNTITNVMLLLGMLVVLLQLDPELTLYALGIVPILFVAISVVTKKIGMLSYETHMQEGKVFTVTEQILSSVQLVQAFAREDEERARFIKENKTSFDRKLSLYSLQTAYGWVVSALTAGGTALVTYVGVTHVLDKTLTVGELLIFIGYLAALYAPVNTLSDTISNIRASLQRARRVFEIMELDESIQEKPGAKPLEITKAEVRYEDVEFGYEPGQTVLKNVSFTAPGGSMVAVVGPTGAGKTSLASLILRFFDPKSGRILIDGQDLRDVSLKSLREKTAVVLQDTQLFPMSVRDNIAYGKRGASDEEVRRAADLANATEFIDKIPGGFQAMLGERGANLSGGQRQRIAIARALLKDAPILILDEPTSALDAQSESLIMKGLERLMEGRTTFVIAHRLSTVRKADLILVIKDKSVAEMGSFDELIAKGGEFARLHALQFGKPQPVSALEALKEAQPLPQPEPVPVP